VQDPKDKPKDHEAELFDKSSEKAKELFAEAKKVRRQAERRTWWNEHKPKAD